MGAYFLPRRRKPLKLETGLQRRQDWGKAFPRFQAQCSYEHGKGWNTRTGSYENKRPQMRAQSINLNKKQPTQLSELIT
jgi:hypothetical protein